jgi:uncharacterized protein (DUF885 family)
MLRAMRLVAHRAAFKGLDPRPSIQLMLDHSDGRTDATAEVERYIAILSQALAAYKHGQLTTAWLQGERQGTGAQVRHHTSRC